MYLMRHKGQAGVIQSHTLVECIYADANLIVHHRVASVMLPVTL
jgi:hypothetical protein